MMMGMNAAALRRPRANAVRQAPVAPLSVRCSRTEMPAPSSQRSRRAVVGMLGGAAALVLAPHQPARAEEDEVDDRYDEDGVLKSSKALKGEVVFQTVPLDGGSSYQVPEGWKTGTTDAWLDPVGGSQVQSVTLYTADATVADITALGKIEYLPLTKLPVPKDVTTADMIALVKTERDGVMYYEWDLAISPKVCAQEQLLIQGLCFPDTVVLLSAAVKNGKLSVMEVRSTEAQWKLGSKAIRSLRKSFKA